LPRVRVTVVVPDESVTEKGAVAEPSIPEDNDAVNQHDD
jgi:hypothetical protein